MGNPKEAGLHRHAFSIKGNEELNIPEVDDPDILILSSAVGGYLARIDAFFVLIILVRFKIRTSMSPCQ